MYGMCRVDIRQSERTDSSTAVFIGGLGRPLTRVGKHGRKFDALVFLTAPSVSPTIGREPSANDCTAWYYGWSNIWLRHLLRPNLTLLALRPNLLREAVSHCW